MADLDELLRAELRARDADIPSVDLLARVHATARRRAVTRRAIAIGSAAVATVVAVLLSLGLPAVHRSAPPAQLPSDPLVLGIRPAWLPPGWTVDSSSSGPDGQEIDLVGHVSGIYIQPRAVIQAWHPGRAPVGTGAGDRIRFGGRTAFLYARHSSEVAWQYRPGGWASVKVTPGSAARDGEIADVPDQAAVRELAVRLAAGVKIGVRDPLRFPFVLDGVPAGLRLTGAVSVPESILIPRYAAISFDMPPGAPPREPTLVLLVDVEEPSSASTHTTGGSFKQVGPDRRVNGHVAHVLQARTGTTEIEVDDVEGWRISLQADAAHVRLLGGERGLLAFAAGVHMLPGSANDLSRWTDRPIR